MGGTKKAPKCPVKNCVKDCRAHLYNKNKTIYYGSFCSTHQNNGTINSYLSSSYSGMKRRVEGRHVHNRGNWKGKPILPRDVFVQWAKNHPDFLSLYKRYVMNDFDRKLAPSINRIDSNKGYTLDNMEWLTSSQNSGLASSVRKMNSRAKKVVYKLLGVSNEK